ncbi:MAG: ATP-binding protein [Myxococcota bacterium]|nr:ATP-binding protein [Myxococcota bacterium]
MKVATRITVATAVVVALASAAYAFFDLRARTSERRMAMEREARALGNTLRASLETQASTDMRDARARADQAQRDLDAFEKRSGETALDLSRPASGPVEVELRREHAELKTRVAATRAAAGLARPIDLALAYRPPSEGQIKDLARASGGWRVVVISRQHATDSPTDLPAAQLRRIRTMFDVPQLTFSEVEEDQFFYAAPLRAVSARDEDRVVLGMLEISRSADVLETTSNDLGRALLLVLLIVGVTTVSVAAVASRFVSQPINKLLGGIDDVAKGDLSHVILSEHDDEIGAIATRFNEMTFSLRESRGETQRQNEAKLALEQRLGQTEKLATIGQLAAEIAHEVGTPLNVIAGRSRSIQRKSKDPAAVEKNAEIIAEQTARITRIIQRLLDFTRRKVGTPEQSAINLNELVSTTMELLAGQFSVARVKTRLDRAEALPKVAGDRDRLQQVLINLLINAVQAMPEGGKLGVETRVVRRARPGLEGGAEQDFVELAVSDTGVGIPAAIKDKIFDPFYTTKGGQGGTGLGLAVVSGIVKEHDGWIDVEDVATGGTIFRVHVPT